MTMMVLEIFEQSLLFQGRFSEIPSVLLTAKHAFPKRKRDAATLWSEDVTKTSFKICIREQQNFDGLHRNISVVSTSKDLKEMSFLCCGSAVVY